MKVHLREARPADASHLADICLHADRETFEFLLGGLGCDIGVRDILSALCGTEHTVYSYRFFTLAESDGVVVGGFNAMPSAAMTQLDDNLVAALQTDVGLGPATMLRWFCRRLRLAARAKAMPVPEDSLLIGNLAVFPAYRGQGIGEILVRRAAEAAADARCRSLCLFVWEDRAEATRLYERVGFETRSAARFRPHRLLPHRGRRLMELALHAGRNQEHGAKSRNLGRTDKVSVREDQRAGPGVPGLQHRRLSRQDGL